MSAQTTANAVAMQASRVLSFVNAYVSASATVQTAKVSMLTTVRASLEGVAPITKEAWKEAWAEDAKTALAASGMSEGSVSVTVSRLKMVAMALTNGIPPLEGEAFQTFYDRCGDALRAKGLIDPRKGVTGDPEPRTASVTADPAQYIADGFDDDAKGRKEAKALIERLGGAERAMALMIVCDQSESLAGVLATILPTYEAEFRQFAAGLLDAPKGAPATVKRVRRA